MMMPTMFWARALFGVEEPEEGGDDEGNCGVADAVCKLGDDV